MYRSKWPKVIPPLTPERQAISDDFMKYWHEVLPKYQVVENFNHNYVVNHSSKDFKKTLEIGAGLGEHLDYERLTSFQESQYVALELRENMASRIKERFPNVNICVADCQEKLPFPEEHFDRIIAIHVLEHLPNLPAAIREIYRVCDKSKGRFLVVIPCEGGVAYGLARRISAKRLFEKRYKQPYQWFIEREHINFPQEILEELAPYFIVEDRAFFPLKLPLISCNLCIGLELKARKISTT
jgi:ubiquinone/menaquinone biosynthesis C-methylase UbiE